MGYILGPIIFNDFINNLLLFMKKIDICNCADIKIQYSCGKDLNAITNKLDLETSISTKWLKDIKIVSNPPKF